MRNEGAGATEPLVVGGFDPIYFRDEERLTRTHLDQVGTDRPIFVFHASAHLATVNSAMLELHDITRDSTTVGVARDADGEPNGELQEMPAMSLASSALHRILRAMNDPASIEALGQICANQGITMLTDLASAGPPASRIAGAVAHHRRSRRLPGADPATSHRRAPAGSDRLGRGRRRDRAARATATPTSSAPPG